MIRAPLGDEEYWEKWTEVRRESIRKKKAALQSPPSDPDHEPQFVFSLARQSTALLIQMYSKGEQVSDLNFVFPDILDAWETSNRLSDTICKDRGVDSCRDWVFSLQNLRHYNWCLWLVALALTLKVSDGAWNRLLQLVGGEGEDVLLDRIVSTRQQDRRIGSNVCHPKPYQRLLNAIDAPAAARSQLLLEFVDRWYIELERQGEERLWWYDSCDTKKAPLETGNYFGCWCFEAAAVAQAFDIDDCLCLDRSHYPGDLLRPDGPSIHSALPRAAQSLLDKARRLLGRVAWW